MKKDIELMRKILSNITNDKDTKSIDGYDEQIIRNCKAQLIDWGYAEGPIHKNTETSKPFVDVVIIRGITEKGYNFLSEDEQTNIKTEITNNNYNMHINENKGVASIGHNNTINTKFEEKFTQLIEAIEQTNIEDKSEIVLKLNEVKNDKQELNKYLGILLTRGAEVATLIPVICGLLGISS